MTSKTKNTDVVKQIQIALEFSLTQLKAKAGIDPLAPARIFFRGARGPPREGL